MAKQVAWNKRTLNRFIEEAMLSEEEILIMTTRVQGWTRIQQSMRLNMSTSKIDKIIARLKVKYDKVQANDPLLPPRKFSAKETYMDTH